MKRGNETRNKKRERRTVEQEKYKQGNEGQEEQEQCNKEQRVRTGK